MINIQPINAFNDNYIWAVIDESSKQTIVVDPGQADPVIDYLSKHSLTLSGIWITHKHSDHIGGVKKLQDSYPNITVVANEYHKVNQTLTVGEGSEVIAFGYKAKVISVKGHTENHLAYILDVDGQNHVFCGDTLFSGGCGRVFTGDMHAMYDSLSRLASFDDNSLFYPAHEYTAGNLLFGLFIEPDNQIMAKHHNDVQKLVAEGIPSVPSKLELEKHINIFLRVQEQSVIQALADKIELNDTSPASVFAGLRTLKDNFKG